MAEQTSSGDLTALIEADVEEALATADFGACRIDGYGCYQLTEQSCINIANKYKLPYTWSRGSRC